MTDKSSIILTPTQESALEEFKLRMSDELDEFKTFDRTFVAYRFMKGRNWDTIKAEAMLKKCVQWRRQNHITTLFREYEPPEVLKKYFNNFFIGNDKEGCPIFYGPVGKYDVKGMFKATTPTDIDTTLSQMFDKYETYVEEESEKKDRWLTGFVYIMNCSGLTIANATNRKGLDIFAHIVRFQQDNAPERLKAVYFINTPSFFTIPFSILKSFLNSVTLRKIHVYGTDGWQEALLKIIDADQLPAFMGGTRTDPDGNPHCKTILCQFGLVDKSYYLDKNKHPLSDTPDVKTLHVFRSSSSKIHVGLKEAGSTIEWEFVVKHGDIGFGLFFQNTDEEEEEEDQITEVIPIQRYSPNDIVETGKHECEKPGNYFMLFDNSYSWFRAKEIFYRIKVLNSKKSKFM